MASLKGAANAIIANRRLKQDRPKTLPAPRKTSVVPNQLAVRKTRASTRSPRPTQLSPTPGATSQAWNSSNRSSSSQAEEVKEKLRTYDGDGDGTLTFDEFRMFFLALRADMSDKHIEALFKQVDVNKTGTVTYDELIDFLYSPGSPAHKSMVPELEVEIPIGGGGLALGGKLGNVVVNGGFNSKIRVGWRAVALDGERMEPQELALAFVRHVDRKRKFKVTFEVDEKTERSQQRKAMSRRAEARRQLEELLCCDDLSALGNQTPEQRLAQLSDERLPGLLVDAHAVFEAEVLLGQATGEDEARHVSFLQALDNDEIINVAEMLDSYPELDLLKRDEDGNVPLHVARSPSSADKLLCLMPEARNLKNAEGRNPLNEYVRRNPKGCTTDMIMALAGDDEETQQEVLLSCDNEGISAAMLLEGKELAHVEDILPSWEQLSNALNRDLPEMSTELRKLGDNWPSLLAFHCFGSVVSEGTHTPQSWERLGMVWSALSRVFDACKMHEGGSLEIAKALLAATKGPRCPPIDMRLPYRGALEQELKELHEQSVSVLNEHYEALSGDAAEWLKFGLQDYLSEDLVPDALAARHGLQKRIRMDFELKSGGGASSALNPDWIAEPAPTFDEIFKDLANVGMLGQVRQQDAVYDMLRLAGMDEIQSFSNETDNLLLTRCYAAHMRGVCEAKREVLNNSIQAVVAEHTVVGETFFPRKEAKKLPRIVEKTLERIEEINQELKEEGTKLSAEGHDSLRRAAAFICDINGVMLVADNPEEIKMLYHKLSESFRVLRVKNTYAADGALGDYRDVKLSIAVDCDEGEFVVEVQLLLAHAYNEKQWMHLPYTFARGDMDWHYIRTGPETGPLFCEGWRLYHGIQGESSKRDMWQAEQLLVAVADQGHFVARGLCHREGWGDYEQDGEQARKCFAAAAGATNGQCGNREGKTRLGLSHIGELKDASVHRRRGLQLLQQAAEEGEPEAVFQLSFHEQDYQRKRELLEIAARMGHKRAVDRVSGSNKSVRKLLMD